MERPAMYCRTSMPCYRTNSYKRLCRPVTVNKGYLVSKSQISGLKSLGCSSVLDIQRNLVRQRQSDPPYEDLSTSYSCPFFVLGVVRSGPSCKSISAPKASKCSMRRQRTIHTNDQHGARVLCSSRSQKTTKCPVLAYSCSLLRRWWPPAQGKGTI
ncbi:hypothetical protein PHLGIDRAFT_253467 [Phlebiopsis gigantea 11061_1 CR5-6]|uniref:Uncharacterized protein n=1 Tax=Phlebiopsis gigantea (strain 11061_1 CR5-6) TaxID=745531 RepID=A0A0C3S1I9_PHLG1|nr:hypothetical protein PHLGIDRAFT_253467 [Phlebiopsis gigantea 11061_1 CR5-6]